MRINHMKFYRFNIFAQITDYSSNELIISNDIGSQMDVEKKEYLSLLNYAFHNVELLRRISFLMNKRNILIFNNQSDLPTKNLIKADKFLFTVQKIGNSSKYGLAIQTRWSNVLFRLAHSIRKIRPYSVLSRNLYSSLVPKSKKIIALNPPDFNDGIIPLGYTSKLALFGNSEKWGLSRTLKNLQALIEINNELISDKVFSKKIGVVTHALPSGGAEKQSILLVSELRRLGIETHLLLLEHLTKGNSTHLDFCLKQHVVPLMCKNSNFEKLGQLFPVSPIIRELLNPQINPYAVDLANLIDTLLSEDITEIISSLDGNNIVSLMAAVILNKNVHISFRSYAPDKMDHINKVFAKEFYKVLIKFNKITFSGNSTLGNNDYATYLNISPSKILFIENFLQDSIRNDSMNQILLDSDQEIDVLGIFRLSSEKNPFLFLQYCTEIRKYFPGAKFTIVGTGPLKKDVENEINSSSLNGSVNLVDVTNIESTMSRAKVILLTSEFEGTPNVILEAMAKGLPVFATNVGGIGNLLSNGRGFLLNPKDISKDAGLISLMLNSPDLRREVGIKSKKFIAEWRENSLIAQDFLIKS